MISVYPLNAISGLIPPLFKGPSKVDYDWAKETFNEYAPEHLTNVEGYLEEWSGKEGLDVDKYAEANPKEVREASIKAYLDISKKVRKGNYWKSVELADARLILGPVGMYEYSKAQGTGAEKSGGGPGVENQTYLTPQQINALQNAAQYKQA